MNTTAEGKSGCLFLVNGLGMGNATRCFAVIEHIHRAGVPVHVLTSGNGLFFFRGREEVASVRSMTSLHYGKKGAGRLSVLHTFTALSELRQAVREKSERLAEAVAELRPAVVVADSEYCVRPARGRVPLLALNNSDVVVSEYLRRRHVPRAIWPQFWCIELMDYLFHCALFDVVLSPAIRPVRPRHRKFRRIGLIVRSRLLQALRERPPTLAGGPLPDSPRIVFMLSGSTFSSQADLSCWDLPVRIDVVGREGQSTDTVRYHGKLKDNTQALLAADLLVINAGFSAVGEALALGKPTLVIPVPGHAEQYINAQLLSEAKRGYVVTAETVVDKLKEILARGHVGDLDMGHVTVDSDGAGQAASAILDVMRGGGHARVAS